MASDGFDVVVIGAGVVGLAIAAAVAKRGRSVLILERDSGIARGVTSRNSEVIHAGLYYPAESAKAEFCVRGRRALYAYCRTHRIGHRKTGKLVVATRPEEESVVADLLERGRANGVEGLEILDAAAIGRLEPEVAARLALWSPETGIVDAHGFCLALLAEAEAHEAILALGRRVEGLRATSHGWTLEVAGDDGVLEQIDAGLVVDAAGLDADRIAALAGLDPDSLGWRQRFWKGDYFSLGPGVRVALQRLVYPVPAGAGLGIHATLDLAGRLRFGPDATYLGESARGFGANASAALYDVAAAKATEFRDAAARYLPALREAEFVPDYAGIRPKLSGPGEGFRDFVVEEASSVGAPGFVACIGIESPGLTAALAIADHVVGWSSV